MDKMTRQLLESKGFKFNSGRKIVAPDDMSPIVRGSFGNIIDFISDEHGYFDPATIKVNENTPVEVVNFVRSFMSTPVVPLPPDATTKDADVFGKIIPRHVGDASSLSDYLDHVVSKSKLS